LEQIYRFDSLIWCKQRTAEYRMSNRRMSKDGFATLFLFLAKIDRIPYFDIRHSIFIIRYSLWWRLFFD